MPSSLLDLCRFTPAAGGTSDWAYSSAVQGYQGPTAAGAVNGVIYSYRAESSDLSQWEVGIGAYNSGTTTFVRTTVLFNSSGTTAKINFSTVPQVAIVALAEDLASLVNANSLAGVQSVTNTTEATGVGTTAATIISGGLEVLKKLFVSGVATFKAAVASTSTTTGSVVVTGGVGVSGAIYAGGAMTGTQHISTTDVSTAPSVDGTATTYVIGAGVIKQLPISPSSGLLVMRDMTIQGSVALFLYSSAASTVTLVAQSTGGPFVVSPTPTASQWGVYDSGSRLNVKNGGAGNNTISIYWIKM